MAPVSKGPVNMSKQTTNKFTCGPAMFLERHGPITGAEMQAGRRRCTRRLMLATLEVLKRDQPAAILSRSVVIREDNLALGHLLAVNVAVPACRHEWSH